MSRTDKQGSAASLLHGLQARMARGPVAQPLVERIDEMLAGADGVTGLTEWVVASDLIGGDQTLGRMLLEMFPAGFVGYAVKADGCIGETAVWPSEGGSPRRAEAVCVRFDAGYVRSVTNPQTVDISLPL